MMQVMQDTIDKYPGSGERTRIAIRERRMSTRVLADELIAVAFYHHGRLFCGAIIDLSDSGASLVLDSPEDDGTPLLYKGRRMECYLTGGGIPSKFRGTVEWVHAENGKFFWGVTFIELSRDEYDPLRVLIRKVCSRAAGRLPDVGTALY